VDFETAYRLLINQGMNANQDPDALLSRLGQGSPPIPGQVTSILLALKMVEDTLKDETVLERQLVSSLHQLAYESRQEFERGKQQGVSWPPLLEEDLTRIAAAVQAIFSGS